MTKNNNHVVQEAAFASELVNYGVTSMVPKEHPEDHLLVIVPPLSYHPETRLRHFAFIIAAEVGICIWDSPSIDVCADIDAIYYREGELQSMSKSSSWETEDPQMYAFKYPFPEMVGGFRMTGSATDEVADYTPPVAGPYQKKSRYPLAPKGGAGIALNMARFWNEMEQQSMSWQERVWKVFEGFGEPGIVYRLQLICLCMGLKEGVQVPSLDQKIASMERVIRDLEVEHWRAVKADADLALQTSGAH